MPHNSTQWRLPREEEIRAVTNHHGRTRKAGDGRDRRKKIREELAKLGPLKAICHILWHYPTFLTNWVKYGVGHFNIELAVFWGRHRLVYCATYHNRKVSASRLSIECLFAMLWITQIHVFEDMDEELTTM